MRSSIKLIALFISILLINGCKEDSGPTEPQTPPPTPVLSSPADNSTDVSIPVTLNWLASDGAASYGLQISTDTLFSNIVYDSSGFTTRSRSITSLNNLTKYYWRVNATNQNGTSAWSNNWSFTTIRSCGSTIDYGGKLYNIVQIKNQCWLKENLDIGTMIQGTDTSKDNGIIEKYCYNNKPESCNTYGGLYQWNEAMQYSITPGARGICPEGWHIPTYAEFQACSTAVNGSGNALKAIGQGSGGGIGTNTSGFSALLAGSRQGNGNFASLSFAANFWNSTEASTTNSYVMQLYYSNSVITSFGIRKDYGFSIRCVQD
jgi:uncharacterized protein (TIGR02145 family)